MKEVIYNWDNSPVWANYAVLDSDANILWFVNKPVISSYWDDEENMVMEYWNSNEMPVEGDSLDLSKSDFNWKNSMQRRPNNV